jgi:AAA15 family ATPase/GTPase
MILESLKYTKLKGKPYEWGITGKDGNPVQFGNINLIVGKNAAGKSRILAVVKDMAELIAQEKDIAKIKVLDWSCQLVLKDNEDLYDYRLSIDNGIITDETLSLNEEQKLNRKENKIYSEQEKAFASLDGASATNVATSMRAEKYPYLSELFKWSGSLKKFGFTNHIEKNRLLKPEELESSSIIDESNVIQLFNRGVELFGKDFTDALIADMKYLNFPISSITLVHSKHGVGLSAYEEDMSGGTLQVDMSPGMFRALAFVIQLNFALLNKTSVCLLIDDLGEGLDFSRAKLLIEILIHKINNTNIQIFITTNDRYVMNKIPLKYWSVLERTPKSTLVYNYYNSRETFDDFRFTGLNNFDFLATDFYLHGFDSEQEG